MCGCLLVSFHGTTLNVLFVEDLFHNCRCSKWKMHTSPNRQSAYPPKRQERFTTGDAIFGLIADFNGDTRVIGLDELLMGVMQGDAWCRYPKISRKENSAFMHGFSEYSGVRMYYSFYFIFYLFFIFSKIIFSYLTHPVLVTNQGTALCLVHQLARIDIDAR